MVGGAVSRDFWDPSEIPLEAKTITLSKMGMGRMNNLVEYQPYVSLVLGKDIWGWGVTLLIGHTPQGARRQRCELAVNRRWGLPLEGPPECLLLAQSVMRKVAIERAWPIP